ncbi:MAG TPA: sensor histidine kinase [Bradyrhizobium sp.]|uniref:sensor histidine kinase n=1 Tax=Bradyrhizobium sp. TaxID=376 RepID=UPI002D7E40E0|nr:sensor histidine kinase [Bradyrhizobium sp.]HET7889274.1 sensor histidine kinase [Bradyrhizobium sp.]
MNKLYPLLLEHRLPVLVRYGIVAAIMLACATLQMALQMLTGYPSYFLLLPGIFLSGLIFNRGTGMAAAAIAIIVSGYLSYGTDPGPAYVAESGLFIVTAAGTAVVAEFLRAEMKRVMHADKTKSLLLQEMAHRTKNNLAVLSAMIRLQARGSDPAAAAALEAAASRIHVTAQVYDHLSLKQDSRLVDMRYYLNGVVDKIFQSLAPPGVITFEVLCEDVDLPHNQALAIGIVTNELVTNALKYAFPDGKAGQVSVELKVAKDIELTVSDNGVGHNSDGDPCGLGSRIIRLLTQQLDGTLDYERLQPGLSVRLHAPRAPLNGR